MAERREVIIDVKIDAGESAKRLAEVKNNIAALKAEQKELTAAAKENGAVTAEQAARMAAVQKELKDLTRQEKIYSAELTTATGGNKEYARSLESLSLELAKMKAEYRGMSKEMRDSAAGQELQKSIQALDQSLKDADSSLGDHFRYVGDYRGALKAAGLDAQNLAALMGGGFRDGLAKAGASLKGLAKSMLATPIGWLLAGFKALQSAFAALKGGFDRNDEASTRLQAALERFRPILDWMKRALGAVADTVSRVVDGMSRMAAAVLDVIPGFKAASEAAAEHVQAIDRLEQVERDYTEASARRSLERAKLEDEARHRQDLSTRERVGRLKKALELERQDMEERKAIAAEKLRIAEEEARRIGDTSDATMNKIASLRAAYISSETEFITGTRRLAGRLADFERQLAQEEAANIEERRRKWQEWHRERVEAAKKATEELRKLEDLQAEAIEDSSERARKQIELTYTRQIDGISKRLEEEKNLTEEARESMAQQVVLLREKMWKELAAVDDEELQRSAEAIRKMEEETTKAAAAAAKAAAEKSAQERARLTEEYRRAETAQINAFEEQLNKIYGNVAKAAEIALNAAKTTYDNLVGLDAETKAALFASEEDYKSAVLAAEREMLEARQQSAEAMKSQADEVASVMKSYTGAISDLFEAAAGDSETYEKYKKAIAIVDAVISMAQTIAAATTASTAGDPYTMAIRIAANVAAVTAQFASVIASLKKAAVPTAPKFAQGGLVPGTSYSGDKVSARLNSREMVLTLEQQQNLFELIRDGARFAGPDYGRIAAAFREAVAELPPPVMDYSEFTAFKKRVRMLEQL